MSNVNEIWACACSLLKEQMLEISYKTWILTLEPGLIKNSTFYIVCTMTQCMDFLLKHYYDTIFSAVTKVDPSIKAIQFVSKDDIDELKNVNVIQDNKPNGKMFNPKYTFESFVVGSNNRFVYTVALAVAESPSTTYNPLFIYGGVGLGKTHLLHAIGNFIHQEKPDLRIMYITGETFMNELIASLRAKDNTQHFKNKYRNLDILMVDDIQFIAGKTSTQEEFFHTFNTLFEMGKQIILTSDRMPSEIAHLEDRLKSRFAWGLLADIQSPDIETRIAILKKKAEIDGINISDDACTYIAEKINSNVRELEGALLKLKAYAALNNAEISLALVKEALRDTIARQHEAQASCERIIEVVSRFYNISIEDLKGTRRAREFTEPRQIAMYLSRELLGMSYPRIGQNFGNRDHSTVVHAYNKILKSVKVSPRFATQINDLVNMININNP